MTSVTQRRSHTGKRRALGIRWTLAAALLTLAAAPARPFDLPPIAQSHRSEHHPGKLIWVELATPDLESAKRFYGQLFGWTFSDAATSKHPYSIALLDGMPVAGLVQRPVPAGEHRQSAWLTFLSVRDVKAAEQAVTAHGGKVLSPPHAYPQRGSQAVFADPQGAVFAVLQSSSGDPPDVLAAPREWIWSSLHTRDPNTDAAFYQTVFGYEVFDATREGQEGFQHLVLGTDGYARASINLLPSDQHKRHPHWLNFVRVASPKEIAAKAEELGGRVLVQPHPDRHGGLIALLADPGGAPFGVIEWTDSDSQERTP